MMYDNFHTIEPQTATNNIQTMRSILDMLEREYWASHKLLGETPYSSSSEQLADMQRLGRISEALAAIRLAINTYRDIK